MRKNIKPQSGFTLIELMIVMAIMALLMALVGPLTVDRYEKTKGIEEALSFKNWLVANSYRAFATGHSGVFVLAGKKVTFVYKNESIVLNRFQVETTASSLQMNKTDSERDENEVISSLEFNYIFFQPQTINVNSFGIINDKSITMTVSGNSKILRIDKDIYDYEI